MIGKTDAALAQKLLTVSHVPHIDTRALVQKLDEVSKEVDQDVSTIPAEQMKKPIIGTVRSWVRANTSPAFRSPEIQLIKGLLRYCQKFNRLVIEEEGPLLCYNEPSDKLDEENFRICLLLSLFHACFRLGHYNGMVGHMGTAETYANAKRFYYWPGMFDWIFALTADCLTCQTNKPKPGHRSGTPLEEWQNETVLFRTVHIDHEGPLHPTIASNAHCLLIIDAFSHFLMVYPAAIATVPAVENWILSIVIPQSIIYNRGTAFIYTEFVNWSKQLGITLKPPTAHSPWTNNKIETQNQHIDRYWRSFENGPGHNWSSLGLKIEFTHNTSVNYTTEKTPFEIVFGTEPQILMSLKLGLYQNKHKFCCSNFCKELRSDSHTKKSWKTSYWTTYFNRNYHKPS